MFDWSYELPTAGDIPDADNQATYHLFAETVNLYRIRCKVRMRKTAGPDAGKIGVLDIRHRGRFAAIGGPLNLGVRKPTDFPDPGGLLPRIDPWEHMHRDETQAFYLQHFASGEQVPQWGYVWAATIQPEGTKLTVQPPEHLVQETPDTPETLPTDKRIMKPLAQFQAAPVTGFFTMSFVDDDGQAISGESGDITETFRTKNSSNVLVAPVRTFTARSPATMGFTPGRSLKFDPGDTWRCGSADAFQLRDGFGDVMPSVFVQERFQSTPSGFVGNKDKQAWRSNILTGERVGFRDGIYTYPYPDNGDFLKGPGWLHLTDNIWWKSPSQLTIGLITHEFFAATKRNVVGQPGVSLGSYGIDLVVGSGPPESKPGTANQSKIGS